MRLVVCDDHEVFLDAFVHALVSLGHEVVGHTSDPESVVDMVARWSPDICVLDIDFAGQARLDLPLRLREIFPGTKLVLLSGTLGPQAWQTFEEGWVDALLCKSCDVQSLDAALHRVDRGAPVPLHLAGSPAEPPSAVTSLTDRERDVLALIVRGAGTQQIARKLGVSNNTVRTHVQHVFDKLGVHSRAKAAALVAETNLLGGLDLEVASA